MKLFFTNSISFMLLTFLQITRSFRLEIREKIGWDHGKKESIGLVTKTQGN
jgi:hypothetical protein